MLNAAEFIHGQLQRLHKYFDKALAGLTPEQLHAVPGGQSTANTIAFTLFHCARTEDNVVRWVIQDRRPTVWTEGGYPERLGLPPVAQGTGMSTAEAQALRIRDIDLFRQYMQAVWASTDELFARRDDTIMDKVVLIKPLGEMPALQAVGQICLTHGMAHFGEIELARTLVGPGPSVGV